MYLPFIHSRWLVLEHVRTPVTAFFFRGEDLELSRLSLSATNTRRTILLKESLRARSRWIAWTFSSSSGIGSGRQGEQKRFQSKFHHCLCSACRVSPVSVIPRLSSRQGQCLASPSFTAIVGLASGTGGAERRLGWGEKREKLRIKGRVKTHWLGYWRGECTALLCLEICAPHLCEDWAHRWSPTRSGIVQYDKYTTFCVRYQHCWGAKWSIRSKQEYWGIDWSSWLKVWSRGERDRKSVV